MNQKTMEKETHMKCKNCPDRILCYSSTTTWKLPSQRETTQTLLRIMRCRRSLFGF